MRHVLTLFDDRVGLVAAVLLAAAGAVSRPWARRSGWPTVTLFAALASIVLILAATIVNRWIRVSDDGLAHDLTWWTRNWSSLLRLVTGDIGWWLNVVLFVPAGVAWSLLTGKPLQVFLALAVASIAIETLHSTVLTGAADATDLLANVLGAAVGVTCGDVLARARRSQGLGSPRTENA